MKIEKLRPIGTEFWYEYQHLAFANKQVRFLYRVISHDRIALFPGDMGDNYGEGLRAIKMEVREVTSTTQCSKCFGVGWIYAYGEWKFEEI